VIDARVTVPRRCGFRRPAPAWVGNQRYVTDKMTKLNATRVATINGARALGLDNELAPSWGGSATCS